MHRVFRSIWAVLIWLFVVLIPVQFYLAGHGAMEGAHAADKKVVGMTNAWDPHLILGTVMALIAILILITAFASGLPSELLRLSGAFFVVMLIQYILPIFIDSSGGRAIAALHAVNALIVTGLAIMLAMRAREYLPFGPGRSAAPAGAAHGA